MGGQFPSDRLSGISTMWTVLRAAHGDSPESAAAAKEILLARYGGAVRRYLLGLLRDPHAADDLTQEFAIRLLTGGFHGADPNKGRFRNYVKTTLFHLVSGYLRKQRAGPGPLANEALVEAEQRSSDPAVADAGFDQAWRAELLSRTWSALANAHTTYHTVLQARAAHPSLSSDDLAPKVTEMLGKPITPANLRQTLKRARDLFAELLVDEVSRSLNTPTPEGVDEELAELNLLQYVKPSK